MLAPTRLAILDGPAVARITSYPELVGAICGRAMQRSRSLAVQMAIVQHPRVEVRLSMLLWHLAERWGRVSAHGVVLPLRLTHAVLGSLVAARRPTVTIALADLARRNVVVSNQEGWLLIGTPSRARFEAPSG